MIFHGVKYLWNFKHQYSSCLYMYLWNCKYKKSRLFDICESANIEIPGCLIFVKFWISKFQGVYVLMSGLDLERLCLAASPVGLMQVIGLKISNHWIIGLHSGTWLKCEIWSQLEMWNVVKQLPRHLAEMVSLPPRLAATLPLSMLTSAASLELELVNFKYHCHHHYQRYQVTKNYCHYP